jgi:hypothetical protein
MEEILDTHKQSIISATCNKKIPLFSVGPRDIISEKYDMQQNFPCHVNLIRFCSTLAPVPSRLHFSPHSGVKRLHDPSCPLRCATYCKTLLCPIIFFGESRDQSTVQYSTYYSTSTVLVLSPPGTGVPLQGRITPLKIWLQFLLEAIPDSSQHLDWL